MSKDETLSRFGEMIISEVRDEAIDKYEMIVLGKMKSLRAVKLNTKLASFSDDQRLVIREVVVNSIDDALHNFLRMIEQHEEHVQFLYGEDDTTKKEDIRKLSDGLSGEFILKTDGFQNSVIIKKDTNWPLRPICPLNMYRAILTS